MCIDNMIFLLNLCENTR